MSIQTVNPATNILTQSFIEMTDDQFNDAVAKAEITYQTWKLEQRSTSERTKAIHNKIESGYIFFATGTKVNK